MRVAGRVRGQMCSCRRCCPCIDAASECRLTWHCQVSWQAWHEELLHHHDVQGRRDHPQVLMMLNNQQAAADYQDSVFIIQDTVITSMTVIGVATGMLPCAVCDMGLGGPACPMSAHVHVQVRRPHTRRAVAGK